MMKTLKPHCCSDDAASALAQQQSYWADALQRQEAAFARAKAAVSRSAQTRALQQRQDLLSGAKEDGSVREARSNADIVTASQGITAGAVPPASWAWPPARVVGVGINHAIIDSSVVERHLSG